MQKTDLNRFHIAQSMSYDKALGEIKKGIKTSHWMWYIFPQLKGLGKSPTSQFYGISNLEEAKAYLDDEILGPRLKEITNALLNHSNKRIETILGDIDSKKLKSSMTLFDIISPNDVFQVALETFFGGKRCKRTLIGRK